MGQLIRLPVSKSPCSGKPRTTGHAPAKTKGKPAKVLMFTGVRYERGACPPSQRLPVPGLVPEFGRS